MKRAIFGITASVPRRDTSHAAGWAAKWAELLNADIVIEPQALDAYGEVYIWNDINGEPGKVNLFGFKKDNDVGRKVQIAVNAIKNFQGLVYQLDYAQDYYATLTKRGLSVPAWFIDIEHKEQWEYSDTLVIGDSHSISVAPVGAAVIRNDGKTLRGALKKGLMNFLPNKEFKSVTFKFGDIDMRHHACRKDKPNMYIMDLAEEYLDQVWEFKQLTGADVSVVMAMPQTPDERKIPKTGFFDNTPYYGSLEERNTVTQLFNAVLDNADYLDIEVVGYSDEYYTEDGLLDMNKMEAKQSFHLAPKWYLHVV